VSKLFARALPDYGPPVQLADNPADCPQARDLADRMLTVSNTHWLDEAAFSRIIVQIRRSL
jgi:hypothetical protein